VTLALGEVMSGAALVTSLMVALLSYAVRQRDADIERRLGLVETLTSRTATLETRAAVNERDLVHMRDDLSAVRTAVAELLTIARGTKHVED
jgi:hypothetical protein